MVGRFYREDQAARARRRDERRSGLRTVLSLALLSLVLAAIAPSVAQAAATAPGVTTERASSITENTATLNATVDPNEANVTECKFEYGTTPAYGTSVSCSSLPGSGENEVGVSAAIAGLSESTTYHYRVVATNEVGTSYGTDRRFTTLPDLPSVITNDASQVTNTGANLNGVVNPNDSNVTECQFEYGTSKSYGTSVPCSSLPGSGDGEVGVSAAIASLSESTTYHFRLVATNMLGTTYGSDRTFTTLPNAPTVVTERATSVTKESATLNAMVNPHGKEVTSCKFEYGTSLSYEKSVSCSSLPGSGESPVEVSAPVTGLSESTTYHFRIVAGNSLGTSFGADRTFKTPPHEPSVSTEAATSVTKTEATLNATVNPNDANVTECKFEYGTSLAYGTSAACSSLPGSGGKPVAVSAPVSSLSESKTYHFRIVATNSKGTSYGLDRTFSTLPQEPRAVTESASAVGASTATLNATVNPRDSNVTNCHFEYGTSVGYGTSVACTSLPGSGEKGVDVSAPVTGLGNNTTYHFRIVATNGLGTAFGADHTFKTLESGLPPSIKKVSPKKGGVEGGTGVTISGANFEGTTKVLFGEVEAASYVVDSAKQITAVSPKHAMGLVDVRVVTSNGTSAASSKDHFTFKPSR
jgi:hypothetical protein